jgi:glycosyltransferase involved in cell wall biosynthesis
MVDARSIDHPTARQRGIGRHVTGLLQGLVDIDAPVIAMCSNAAELAIVADAVDGLTTAVWSPESVRDRLAGETWYLATQLLLHPITLDPIPSIITQARLPVAALMYDVIPYLRPLKYLADPNPRRQAPLRAALARTVDVMLANSHYVRDTATDALMFPRDRIRTVGVGVTSNFQPSSVAPRPRPTRLLRDGGDRYVVAVTGTDDRKNTEGLLRAWSLLPRSVRATTYLVVATGHTPAVLSTWQKWARDVEVADDVVFTGHVSDDEMVALLQGAALSVFPSLDEGFGLPVIEAAACGCPVICSDVTSIPEVLDEPRACFDPTDPPAIAAAVARGLSDPAHREMLLAAGARAVLRWSWPSVAADIVLALTEIGPRRPMRHRTPDRRIAMAGPFAGSPSGIGAYDEAVVAAVERRRATDVGVPLLDVFVDGSGASQPTDVAAGRRPVRAIGRYAKPWDYDHVIAVLGSSPHHVATAELALAERCHVWLHEASLVGVHLGLAHASGSESWAIAHVRDRLERDETPATRALLAEGDLLDAPRFDELGVTLLGETLDSARSVIVTTSAAAGTVRRLRPDGPPVLVLPLGHPPVIRPDGLPSTPELVAVGWLASNKNPTLAVDVLALLDPSVTLTFVGPSAGDTTAEVARYAAALGVADRVTFTGRLDDDRYAATIARGRVGLQLRTSHRGEMSAAITDLLARGVPTVTTLTTAAPASAGLTVVEPVAASIAAGIRPLLDDDTWTAASNDAIARAEAWTFDDVAAALVAWLDEVDDLPPSTVRHASVPLASRPLHD